MNERNNDHIPHYNPGFQVTQPDVRTSGRQSMSTIRHQNFDNNNRIQPAPVPVPGPHEDLSTSHNFANIDLPGRTPYQPSYMVDMSVPARPSNPAYSQSIHYRNPVGSASGFHEAYIAAPLVGGFHPGLISRPHHYSDASNYPLVNNDTQDTATAAAAANTARRRATRQLKLTKGNLIINCPVPDRLLLSVPRKDEEFRTMRYTAATCDPDDFQKQGYTLRQQQYQRETELFIVITMYNEDEILFTRTMHGVMKNISYLCSLPNSPVWGPDGWQKVVVCIVADGREIINKRVLHVLASMGIYQAGIAKNMVEDKPVTAHIYEFTTQISIDSDMKLRGADKGIVPVQILFCLKEKNAKKINSHRWFFNAFGPLLLPKICILLDVGTRPGNVSIYKLWRTFERNRNIGGACGEIRAMLGVGFKQLLNPLVAAQNFEYKMSNILDKPLESVFGYISVLPGAFSAYRYQALQNDINGHGPLEKYFHGEDLHSSAKQPKLFEANMYLAEDRILCFELVAKRGERWLLEYCQSAFAETDVPEQLPEFISQRRRWLNGSFFAGVYGIWHFPSILKSNHSLFRMGLLCIESVYSFISLLFGWLSLGNFYITFYFITKSLEDPTVDPFGNGRGTHISSVIRYGYQFLLIIVFICSIGNRPQGSRILFILCLVGFAVIMCYMLFAAAWLVYKAISYSGIEWTPNAGTNLALLLANQGLRNMLLSLMATYGLYFISSILYGQPWHMLTSFLPYLLLLPCYVNILSIYAFCNTHDVSWGTKGDNGIAKDLGVVKVSNDSQGVETVEIELPADQLDINLEYEEALLALENKPINPKSSFHQTQDDYYRSFRTHLVLIWIACNALLSVCITSTKFDTIYQESIGTTYMSVILWVNTGLAAFRFLGSFTYLILRLFSSV